MALKKENGKTVLIPIFHSQETISGKVSTLVCLTDFGSRFVPGV